MRISTRTQVLHSVAAALLPALFSAPRFWNGFVFDDVFVIARGDFIHDPRNLPRAFSSHTMVASSLDAAVGQPAMDTFRPLSIASFFLDSALSGRTPWAYHLTNTLLHAAVCVLFLSFLRSLIADAVPGSGPQTWATPDAREKPEPTRETGRAQLALLLTLCFGFAPWLAEAHVFINGRSDLFLALFILSALLLQQRALERGKLAPAHLPRAESDPTHWNQPASCERLLPFVLSSTIGLLALCAQLSKETAVLALPFVALVPCSIHVSLRRRAAHTLPLALAFLAYLALRGAALHGMRTHTDGGQLLAALGNLPLLIGDGVFHALVPTPFALRNLRDDYAGLAIWLRPMSALALVAIGFAVLSLWRRMPVLVWSLGLATATLAPAAMISTSLWPGFGRYLYLPAIGLYTALAVAATRARVDRPRAWRMLALALTTLAAAAAALLLDATLALRDEETMYARALARAPDQAWTVGSLGLARKREGRCVDALPLLDIARTRAPAEPRYAVHLARCLLELGARDAARDVAAEGRARFRNTRAEAAFLIVEVLASSGGEDPAPLLRRCLLLDPARADCRELLARAPMAEPGLSPRSESDR